MSNPTTDSSGRTRRPDPATASQDELLAYYAVDPAAGLGGREADRRRDRSAARPLFATTARTFPECLRATLREPVLWIMLAVSLIALFFDRIAIGLVCLGLSAGHALLCAWLLRRAERVDGDMQRAYDAPLARVLRSGRLCRIGAEAVVPGDILLIYPGDLIPADCRLLRTEHFSVSERELDATDPNRPARRLEKDARVQPTDTVSHRLSPENMVFAGAVAESGYAVALVVSVGSDTHLGALMGSLRPSHGTRRPESIKTLSRVISLISLALCALLIPLVTIGILTLRDRYEFFDIFLSVLALATLGLCELTVAKLAYLTAAIRRDAAMARDSVNAADIRSGAEAERLTTMTDLLLLGTAALHDGDAHPLELCTAGKRYRCDAPDVDDDASAAVELLFLWQHGRTHLPALDTDLDRDTHAALDTVVPTLCEWAETDTDALLLKYKDIHAAHGGVCATIPTPAGNRRITVALTADASDVVDLITQGDVFDVAVQEAASSGASVLFLAMADDTGEGGLVAAFSYAPRISPKTAGWVKGMEAAGIRVAALLSDTGEGASHTLTACGLCDRHPVDSPAIGAPPRDLADRIGAGLRGFTGCTEEEITACIRDLKAAGRVVGVLSVDERDIPHLNAADVAITCSPSLFLTAENDFLRPAEEECPTVPDGQPMSSRTTDLCRRRADVVVRRASVTGGGLGGVRTALLAADRMVTALHAAAGYLFLSNALRLLTVILSLGFGLLPIPAPLLLFSGLVLDTMVLIALARIPTAAAIAPRRSVTEGLNAPWLIHRIRLICLGVTGALPWIVAFIARLLAADLGDGLPGYALLCLIAQQAVLYLSLCPGRDSSGRRRSDRASALALLAFVLVYVGALAVALTTGLHPLYALLIPPIPALLYIIALFVIRRLGGQRAS